MLNDSEIEYNMALYIEAMTKKYQSTKQKRKELQMLINNSAKKIQRWFRKCLKKKKINAIAVIQKWWRNLIYNVQLKQIRINKFRSLYFGIIILNFFRKYCSKKTVRNKNLVAGQVNTNIQPIQKKVRKHHQTREILQHFLNFITRKSALLAEHKYIAKYRSFLRMNFEHDWQAYEKRVSRQLRKEMDKKWVRMPPKVNNETTYLTEHGKQINGELYIRNKLDKIYEESYQKLINTDNHLAGNQGEILHAANSLQRKYHQVLGMEW